MIHDGSSVVFVKTVVYHALGTLMPYPSEDPPQFSGDFSTDQRLFNLCAPNFANPKVGGIHSIYLNEFTFRFNRRFYPFNAFRSLLGIAGDVTAPTYADIYAAKSRLTTSSR